MYTEENGDIVELKFLKSLTQELEGYQIIYRFPNGYGASIVNNKYSHGTELAVIEFTEDSWELTYETPVAPDVIGHVSPEDIKVILDEIRMLPEKDLIG